MLLFQGKEPSEDKSAVLFQGFLGSENMLNLKLVSLHAVPLSEYSTWTWEKSSASLSQGFFLADCSWSFIPANIMEYAANEMAIQSFTEKDV